MDPSDVAQRLETLAAEIRRQGRAAIAAQAAAESCLERLDRLEDTWQDAPAAGIEGEGEAWLRALVPVLDALGRTVERAAEVERLARPRGLARLVGPADEAARAAGALAEGLRVLERQALAALQGLGVTVDRSTGRELDERTQRAVEVRADRNAPDGTVVDVVRPGYALAGRTVREAEVVVAKNEGRG